MEKIFDNGRLVTTPDEAPHPDLLLRGNYVYAAVNSIAHEPLYLGLHLSHVSESYFKLYGVHFEPDTEELRSQLRRLLIENNMPKLGNIVDIYVIPPASQQPESPEVLIAWRSSTIYRGYELISLRPTAMLTNYEIPFSGHRTAVSLTTSDYMQGFAVRTGSHTALRINRSEKLVSCGEYPVFLVKDGIVFTPPAPEPAPHSVERTLMYRACELAGVKVMERMFDASEIPGADEIMVFNHTGIQSVLSLGSHYFYNITALRLEKVLRQITDEGIGR